MCCENRHELSLVSSRSLLVQEEENLRMNGKFRKIKINRTIRNRVQENKNAKENCIFVVYERTIDFLLSIVG